MFFTFPVFLITALISFVFFQFKRVFFVANSTIDVRRVAPPIPHPIGPAIARKALPAAIPPPPDDNAPPPNHANAAFVAAAPDSADIAVPVEAVPKVVAIHIAALGAKLATAIPLVTPAPAPTKDFFTDCNSFCAKSHAVIKVSR